MSAPNFELIDAQRMHQKNPETFWAPETDVLDSVAPGDHVKVSVDTPGERFWVKITEVIITGKGPENQFRGSVSNALVFEADHGLGFGSTLDFAGKFVYDVMDEDKTEYHN